MGAGNAAQAGELQGPPSLQTQVIGSCIRWSSFCGFWAIRPMSSGTGLGLTDEDAPYSY